MERKSVKEELTRKDSARNYQAKRKNQARRIGSKRIDERRQQQNGQHS